MPDMTSAHSFVFPNSIFVQNVKAALLALSDTEKVKPKALQDGTTGDHEGQKHIMLSCECALMHFAHSGAIVAVGNRSSDTAG